MRYCMDCGHYRAGGFCSKDNKVVIKGWQEKIDKSPTELSAEFKEHGAGSILFTNVDVEGLLGGFYTEPVEKLKKSVDLPIVYSGGITTIDDIKKLNESGVEGVVIGSALTIAAFETILGEPGGWLVCIGIALFAFSTILGWEYHGEKAFEYLFNTHKFNIVYRVFFSLIVYLGATTTLKIAWNFSDIANALMAIPNLICLLAMSGVIAKELDRYQEVIKAEKRK